MIDSPRRAAVLTAVLTAVFLASTLLGGGLPAGRAWLSLLLLAANTLPLLLAYRYPLLVTVTLSIAYPVWLETGHQAQLFQSLPTLAALYALGAHTASPFWRRALGLLVPLWMMAAVVSGWWHDAPLDQIGYIAVMFALGWALGVLVAARRSYTRRLEEKTRELEQARRALADQAVADERARIARELHDVVAHAMSVITVRAGVGAHLIESRPGEAAAALTVIEQTGREALSEMRRMLAVLRDPDPRAPRPEPQPGLADLPRLVEQVTVAGTPVSLTVQGEDHELSAGLDLAAYRIVQESLTNVVRHAPGTHAAVTVGYLPTELIVEVRNPGHYLPPAGPGLGIRGMRERAALYDGQLSAGPTPDGFEVAARFPRQPPPSVPDPAGTTA